MWGQPPSAVRRAQPGFGGELENVKFYGTICNIIEIEAKLRLRGQPMAAVPTFSVAWLYMENRARAHSNQRSMAGKIPGSWHGSVIRMKFLLCYNLATGSHPQPLNRRPKESQKTCPQRN